MDSQEKMDLIKSTALELFLINGYEATGIRMICREVGLAPPSLYHFFGSKKGLFFSIASDISEQYTKALVACVNATKLQSLDQRLFHVFRFSIQYTADNLTEVRFFFRFFLFPPPEIREETTCFWADRLKYRKELVQSILEDSSGQSLITIGTEDALSRFLKFVGNNVFDVLLLGRHPGEKEVLDLWNTFLRWRLNVVKEQF